MKERIINFLQFIIDRLGDNEDISLGGYPFGIVIDGYCNYATEKLVLYDSEMHVLGIRWTDPTGDLNEAFGHPFRIIYDKDLTECIEQHETDGCPEVG